MPAEVQIHSFHGTTPTGVDVTGQTLRFKKADNDVQDSADPMPIPETGEEFSYVKQLRLKAITTPAAVIENIKVFSDGALDWTGCGCFLITGGMAYLDPVAQADTGLTGWTDNFGSFTSANPLAVSGHIANPNVGYFGDYVRLQLRVTPTATPGLAPAESVTFRYDEI